VHLRWKLAARLSASPRPPLKIDEHPLGHSAGPGLGDFTHGFDLATIENGWNSLDHFAREVIEACQALDVW